MAAIVISGAASDLGSALGMGLRERLKEKVLLIDHATPQIRDATLDVIRLDVREPSMVDFLRNNKVSTYIHLAFSYFSSPGSVSLTRAEHHEFNIVSLYKALHACSAAGVSKLIIPGFSWVYGASPETPLYVTENYPADDAHRNALLKDWRDCERILLTFQQANPALRVIVLRSAFVVGQNIDNCLTRMVHSPVVPLILGFDPLIQCIHVEDWIDAIRVVVEHDGASSGFYNLAASGALPLLKMIRLADGRPLPLPETMLSLAIEMKPWLRRMGFGRAITHYLKWPCIVDAHRFQETFAFEPHYSTQRAFIAFCEDRRVAHVLEEIEKTRNNRFKRISFS